jgi:hypothetical protein
MLPLRRHRLDLEVVNSPAPPFQQAQITPNATRLGRLRSQACRWPDIGSNGGRLRSQVPKTAMEDGASARGQ